MKAVACKGEREKSLKNQDEPEATLHFQITNSYKPMKEAESKFSAGAKSNAMSLELSSPSNLGYRLEDDMEKLDEQLQTSLPWAKFLSLPKLFQHLCLS